MDKSLHIVIGMTIAYAASFLGLILAWIAYVRRRKREGSDRTGDRDESSGNDAGRG
jgi:hypothetical protein